MMPTNKKTGFTLTELAMAIAFFSILLLTIATVTINLTRNYHKGLTLKSINTVGLGLISEFTSAVSESPVFDIESLCRSLEASSYADCVANKAEYFIYQQFTDNITKVKNGVSIPPQQLPVYGVFCTGKYSYVWNTGYVISQDATSHTMTSNFYSGGTKLDGGFSLRKYYDTGRTFCFENFPVNPSTSKKKYPKNKNELEKNLGNTMTHSGVPLVSSDSSELIKTSDIAIYSMTINSPTVNESGRSLYTGSFVLGSITGDIEINGSDPGCSLDGVSSFDVEYCATNKFNFAMRAMGGNSGN